MSATLVYAIHGFLGDSSDWSRIKESISQHPKGSVDFIAEELFAKDQKGILDFDKQADAIVKKIKSFDKFEGKKILVGYSLGGRIALHILQQNPELFDHYVFLSTNPGLENDEHSERQQRLISDKKWSEKISAENWDNFLKEWNSQSVFTGSAEEPIRNLNNYDLLKLKEAMLKWSLGQQTDFSKVIQMFNYKITWVVGERDTKYCEIADKLKNKSHIRNYISLPAGHRLWLDNPEAVAELIVNII